MTSNKVSTLFAHLHLHITNLMYAQETINKPNMAQQLHIAIKIMENI